MFHRVIDETKKFVDEIIVVNDGSTDNTIKIAKEKGAIVVDNVINRGLGTTMRMGYKEALKRGANIIVQIDADGQYTTEDIPKMVELIKSGQADMVLASRVKGGIEAMPFGKKLGNQIGTIVTRLVSGYPVSDAQTGFRAMRRELIEEIQPRSKYTYVQEMIIRANKEGWKIVEIPSFFKKRGGDGSSRLISNVFSYAKKAVLIILRALQQYHPFVFFGSLGVILIFSGIVLGLSLVYDFLVFGAIGKLPSVILTSLLVIMGIQCLFFGFLADMLNEFRSEVKEEIRDLKKA